MKSLTKLLRRFTHAQVHLILPKENEIVRKYCFLSKALPYITCSLGREDIFKATTVFYIYHLYVFFLSHVCGCASTSRGAIMELRSPLPFNAIPATVIRVVFIHLLALFIVYIVYIYFCT